MFDYNQIREAFNKARDNALKVYADNREVRNWLSWTMLYINESTRGNALAVAYTNNTISAFKPTIDKQKSIHTEHDLYNLFTHEFAHIIAFKLEPNSRPHGREFREIGSALGLQNPNRVFVPSSSILYTLAVPVRQNAVTGKITKKYYYVSKEWLDEHPNEKKYVVKQRTEK